MKRYRNNLKRAAAFALSTMLVVSGSAVSADDLTSYDEYAVFTEDTSFVNDEAGSPSTDDLFFEETDSSSEDADFVSEDAGFTSKETADEAVVTEETYHEGSTDVFSTENTIEGGSIEENIDTYVFDEISSVEAAYTSVTKPEKVTYLKRSWNSQTNQVDSTTEYASCYMVKDYDKELEGWYAVKNNVSLNHRLIITGTANIILCDGARLYCKDGINVKEGNTLNIYCQEGESGELYCDADTNDNAAIGADDEDGDCGTVNIYGGKITADAEKLGTEGAGIGGGDEGNGGKVTIYGGTVKAIGAKFAAGIGGGDADNEGGRGGTTIIYGGNVTAIGGTDAAGIGGGEGGNGGTVEIWGGSVNATSGTNSAGIGGGEYGNGGKITINGGTVNAASVNDGAGIGGGDEGEGGTITINGGTVVAKGGEQGAGIGGGDGAAGGSITINGGEIKAISTGEAAAIGGGDLADCGTIKITGGYVTAEGRSQGAAIGSGRGSIVEDSPFYTLTHRGTIQIEGGTVKAYFSGKEGYTKGAAIGSGVCADMAGTITISGGSIYATSAVGAAIGSAAYGEMSGTITITGGYVNAYADGNQSYGCGAAIGAGGFVEDYTDNVSHGDCTGTIIINGGTVEASTRWESLSSVTHAAAIGHGETLPDHKLKDGTLKIADSLRVTSGEHVGSATIQAYEKRVNGCRMKYAKVEPCTDHTFSKTAVQDSDGKYRYHCTLCNFAEDAADPLSVTQYKRKVSCSFDKLKKGDKTIGNIMAVTGVAGDLSITMTSVRRLEDGKSCRKNFMVSASDGTVTALSGVRKGTYKVKMKVSTSGNDEYEAGERYIAVYVTVS